jgi:protein SCO1/2
MDDAHRLLRATSGIEPLRRHFDLGVNFVGSLVNRHRIEIYVLDAAGRIAASFARVHWREREVVDRAVALLDEPANGSSDAPQAARAPGRQTTGGTGITAFEPDGLVLSERQAGEPADAVRQRVAGAAAPVFATLASLGVAFFPKCAMCWATYATVFGIAGLERIPYSPWMQPVLAAVILVNLASVWWRSRSTGRMAGFYLAVAGVLAIAASKAGGAPAGGSMWGVALAAVGSAISVRTWRR